MKQWFFLCSFSFACLLGANHICPAKNQIVLSSRTRSGKNWYQYSLHQLTGRPVNFLMPSTAAHLALNQKKLWCTHAPNIGRAFNKAENKLVLTLRNYKELFARQTRKLQGEERLKELLNPNLYHEYIAFIRGFEKWHPETRYLYYYEDMMQQPEIELRKILEFIEEPTERLEAFMHNLDDHIKKSIQKYDREIKYSITKGKDNFYHTRGLPKEILQQMDTLMKEYAGQLYDTYLKRFEEK